MALDDQSYRAYRQATYEMVRERALGLWERTPVGKNRGATCAALALLLSNERHDVSGFVLDNELLKDFDLKRDYGINPAPLFRLNEVTADFRARVGMLYSEEEADVEVHGNQLLDEIQEIRVQKLFGRNTEGKLAYIRNMLGISFGTLLNDPAKRRHALDTELRQVQDMTLELLQR